MRAALVDDKAARWRVLRDAVAVAVVAVFGFNALRRCVGDVYPVPSSSMEPTLHGDPQHGDRVYVAKLASPGSRQRHELVVVKHPNEPGQQMVKRIAADGDDPAGCWIDLRDGDIWLGPDRQQLRREQKDPLAARPLRVAWCVLAAPFAALPQLDLTATQVSQGQLWLPSLPFGTETARAMFAEPACSTRRAGDWRLPEGCFGTAQAVDAGYLDATGAPARARAVRGVRDCGMDLLVGQLPATLLLCVDEPGEVIAMVWQPGSGRVDVWRNGEDVRSAQLPAVAAGQHRIEFGRLDDRWFLCINGRLDALLLIEREASWQRVENDAGRTAEPKTHLYLASFGPVSLGVRRLQVFRDLLALRDRNLSLPGTPGDWPRFVPPGHWFLLGDNCFDSRDSRNFDALPKASFLGRPLGVVGPWPRSRWL